MSNSFPGIIAAEKCQSKVTTQHPPLKNKFSKSAI